MDVLFVLRNTEGSENNTCAGAGMNCSSILITASEETRVGLLYIICLFCVIQRYYVFPGLPSPCVYLSAVDGTDGASLWERLLDPEFHWAQCGLDKDTSRTWDCLLSHSNQLSAIDKYTG